jgi:hypothetical protein
MPTWVEWTSMCRAAGSRQARQSTTPSLREYTDANRTPSGKGAASWSLTSAQQLELQW